MIKSDFMLVQPPYTDEMETVILLPETKHFGRNNAERHAYEPLLNGLRVLTAFSYDCLFWCRPRLCIRCAAQILGIRWEEHMMMHILEGLSNELQRCLCLLPTAHARMSALDRLEPTRSNATVNFFDLFDELKRYVVIK